MTSTTYAIPAFDSVVSDGFVPFAWVVNDRPALDTASARTHYFDRGFRLFRMRLDAFRENTTVPTAREERELLFMLQALIEAKRRLAV